MNRREWLGMTLAAAGGVMLAPETAVAEPAEVIVRPTLPKARLLNLACLEGGEMWDAWSSPTERAWLKTDPAVIDRAYADLAQRLGVEFAGPKGLVSKAKALELDTEHAKDVDGILLWSASR